MLPDIDRLSFFWDVDRSQCTYRCVVLPDAFARRRRPPRLGVSQCTYRCVVLPDRLCFFLGKGVFAGLNAPTGAWCSLTLRIDTQKSWARVSQCTYRCVVLPDSPSLVLGRKSP